jgi:signal transduction histidine kinase
VFFSKSSLLYFHSAGGCYFYEKSSAAMRVGHPKICCCLVGKCMLAALWVLIGMPLAAQTARADSLRALLYTPPNHNKQLPVLLQLCEESNSLPPDSLLHYSSRAAIIAKQEGDDEAARKAAFFKAMYLYKKGLVPQALAYVDSLLQAPGIIANQGLWFWVLLLRSNVLIRAGKAKESLSNTLELLKKAEAANDTTIIIKSNSNAGWAFMELGQNRQALHWLFKAAALEQTRSVVERQPYIYSNIAAVYNELDLNDSAEYFVRQAIQVARARADLANLANGWFIYGDIAADMKRIELAEQCLQNGLAIRQMIGDPFYVVSDMYQLGLFYAEQRSYAKGIGILRSGIHLARANGITQKLPLLYQALAVNYRQAGLMAACAAAQDTLLDLKDSLYSSNTSEALAQLQAQYELQKKENTIISQQYDLARKNLWLYTSLALLTVVLLAAAFTLHVRRRNEQLRIQKLKTDQERARASAVMEAENDERRRIAAELHDNVSQKMVAATMNLEALQSIAVLLPAEDRHILVSASSLVKDTADEVRRLSHRMAPQAFANQGLATAVDAFLKQLPQKKLKITFEANGNFDEVNDTTGLMCYRIIQECVQNALKHAAAANLRVRIHVAGPAIHIQVQDDGKGFDAINALQAGTMGLKSIASRVEFLKGAIQLDAAPGRGCNFECTIPL